MRHPDNRGFTLVELIVSITLLSILLALSYLSFSHLLDTYDRTEHKWLVERNVQQTMSLINQAISLSFEAQLSDNPAAALSDSENRVIYQDEDNFVKLRDVDAVPIQLNELPVRISFSNLDETGAIRSNILYISVSAQDERISYTLDSSVYLPNILQSVTVAEGAAAPYTAVSFRTAREGALDLGIGDIGSAGCFIATAAYGDYDQPGVMLLRRFRDQLLLPNPVGKRLVQAYYRFSPPAAQVIAKNALLRSTMRIMLLPLLGGVVLLLHPIFSAMVLLTAFLFGRLIIKGYRKGGKLFYFG